MDNVVRVDFRARRVVQELFSCGECGAVVEQRGWCERCIAELERKQHAFRRYQERCAAEKGLCPGCMKPAPKLQVLGIAEGYVAWHPECAAVREPRL